MTKPLCKSVSALLTTLALAAAGSAHATTVTLDFETAATGLNIVAAPLATALGTITASASAGSGFFGVFSDPAQTGMAGNALFHQQGVDSHFAQLAFDFDVSSVSFLYGGYIVGAFTAQALDSAFNVVDSFFEGDTGDDLPGGPVTLSGSGIRYFRFADAPAGSATSVVDDVAITGSVPLPTTLALAALGLAGLAASRRSSR